MEVNKMIVNGIDYIEQKQESKRDKVKEIKENEIKQTTFKNVAEITEKRINLVEENNEIFPRCKIFSPICQNDE